MTERAATRDDEASWEAPVRELEAIARDRAWDDAVMKQIRAGLRHGHELVKAEAAETAEARRAVATLPRLRQLLTDPSPLVRSAVAPGSRRVGGGPLAVGRRARIRCLDPSPRQQAISRAMRRREHPGIR